MNHHFNKKFPEQLFSKLKELKEPLTDEAGLSGPLRRTSTLETINQVLTGSSVAARVHQTLVHI